jgi:[ribosomal protein S5]-alanine N-acetyltransferase
MPELVLESPRLIIALPQSADAPQALDFFKRNDSHLAPWRPPSAGDIFSEAYWQQQVIGHHEGFTADTNIRLWLWDKADRTRVIGTLGFSQIFRGPFCSCVLGYQLDEAYEGRGFMREALQRSIRYMFEERSMHRIAANYRPENVRSGNLLARLGFRIEGYAKNYLFIDGAWRDHVLTSLVNDAFRPERLPGEKV